MAVWDVSSAITSVRSLISDGASDKFQFKTPAYPTPNLVSTRFFVGETHVVPGSLEVYHNETKIAVSGLSDVDYCKGSFTYAPLGMAPSGQLLVSFYHQWFSDEDIVEFLNEASNMLQFTSYADETIVIALRPTLMQFALYNAYMRKAAEFAETVSASADGYTFSRGAAMPNWKALAELAYKTGQDKLKLYLDNPLSAAEPQMSFVVYRLINYVPN